MMYKLGVVEDMEFSHNETKQAYKNARRVVLQARSLQLMLIFQL